MAQGGEVGDAPTRILTASAIALIIGVSWPVRSFAQEAITITATRIPELELTMPTADTLISGEEARARGALDLRSALSPAAGVEVLPGSDTGPGGSVVAMQGLTEMDAYLLVVDGVPYGGAFNPATATFDLIDFDRIEVIRGAAPVSFGATSFVGVIHVIRAQPGRQPMRGLVQVGTRRSGRVAFASNLSDGLFGQSLLGSFERSGFSQDRSKFERGHLLYRAATQIGDGRLHLDLDGTTLLQDPYSPHPREGSGLSDRFPRDANVNPTDAAADQDRVQANLGTTPISAGWNGRRSFQVPALGAATSEGSCVRNSTTPAPSPTQTDTVNAPDLPMSISTRTWRTPARRSTGLQELTGFTGGPSEERKF